ncbi:MAG: hypothetical protein ACT4OJ_14105 [Bacteroidota bacterium]
MKYCTHQDERLIFLTIKECVDAGVNQHTIIRATYRKSKSWVIIKDPDDARVTLVCYDRLSEDKKELIRTRWGNPADLIARDPIRKMFIKNNEVLQKLLAHRYGPEQKALPIQRIKQYSRACDILDTILRIDESRNRLIKDMGITVPEFYDHLREIIIEEQRNGEKDKHEGYNQLYARFPFHYVSLREKVKEYKGYGYGCIIDKAYGNTCALKVKTDDAKDFLIELMKNPVQHNDVMVTMIYNIEAEKNGWKTITPPTVQNWRNQYAAEITPFREGNAAFNEKFIRQVKGMRPSAPLYLVEHDDNNLDFLFQSEDGKDQYERYVAIVVIDSHCDLVLGKSVIHGDNPDNWQVHHAYLDAMYYIRSLTGDWYLPHELKADQWAKKKLFPLYHKISKFVPPSHGNKHRGYIEQFFSKPIWKNAQKLVSQNNWNGNNMTAKFRGFNPDMLERSFKEKSRPEVGEQAELQIEQFFYLLRNMSDFKRQDMKAPSKQEKWLASWNAMKAEDKILLTDEQFLLTFGITHSPKHTDTIRITNRGVEPQIGGTKYSYDLPEPWMYNKLRGADVQVIYDPYDMSRVLITNNQDIRFIAREALLLPRALKDQYTGSRTFLNALLSEKKDQVKEVMERSAQRKISGGKHAEAMLKSGAILPKEIRNRAEQKVIEKFEEEREQYLEENHDFQKYL